MSKESIGPEMVRCPMCNCLTNCDVLGRVEKAWADHGGTYTILECRGCNSVFYRTVSWDVDDFELSNDENGEAVCELNYSESIYPKATFAESTASGGEAVARPPQSQLSKNRSKGGNPGKFDWARAIGTIVFQWADSEWQPATQGEVQTELGDWFSEQSQTPDDKLLKQYARWLFVELEKRKPATQ